MALRSIPASLSLIPIPLRERLYSLKLWQPGRVKWATCFRDLPFASVAASYLNELSTHTKTSMFHVKHSRLLQTS